MMASPTGRLVVPSSGPADAAVLLLGESPGSEEVKQGRPFVGPSGRVLSTLLAAAGVERDACRIVNVVPVQAPGNDFSQHDERDVTWGRELLAAELAAFRGRLIVPLGDNPLRALLPNLPKPPRWGADDEEGGRARISGWRGSLLPYRPDATYGTAADYARLTEPFTDVAVLPSYHPAAVARLYSLHLLSLVDFTKARQWLTGTWVWPKQRRWYVQDAPAFHAFVERVLATEHLVSVDSEMTPDPIVGIAGEDEVHVWYWDDAFTVDLQHLLKSPVVLKTAHNAGHDWTFLRTLGIDVQPPEIDTGGLASVLNNAFPRNLSPALSTRFTSWPYHKWLTDVDPLRYCGYDSIVCYDAYWAAITECLHRNLTSPLAPGGIVGHDHRLFRGLLDMQWTGVRIDETARQEALVTAEAANATASAQVVALAEPVVTERLSRFVKPHLFLTTQRCPCCGGGTTQRSGCWHCSGLLGDPAKASREDVALAFQAAGRPTAKTKKAMLASLDLCRTCQATGKVETRLPINVESRDQIADLLYRGLGIRPRSFKGRETVRAAALAPLAGTAPLVDAVLAASERRTEVETLRRLSPGEDGRLHATFDPWGTASFRVASSEGLVQRGTNLQNIPKWARYVIVADPGYLLLAPDKAQIEARCVAVLSHDPKLLAAFTTPLQAPGHVKHGQIDSHSYVQHLMAVAGVTLSRDQCKRLTYAAIYGVTESQLETELNADAAKGRGPYVPAGAGATILGTFFDVFAGLRAWRAKVSDEVLRTRRLVSPTGHSRVWADRITRKVWVPGGPVWHVGKQQYGHWQPTLAPDVAKAAWSTLPQDMAAYVLAMGLENVRRDAAGLLTPLIHVHDELVMQVRADRVTEGLAAAKAALDVTLWDMPFPTDFGEPAPNWRCAKGGHSDGPVCQYCQRKQA